jgi:23S rRNA pseudouridine1911/1915/1917 synthase
LSDADPPAPDWFEAQVPAEAAGVRLDRWLAEAHPTLSRSRLKALIETGAVTLDGTPTHEPSARLKGGEVLRLAEPPPEDASPAPQAMALQVLFEDAHVIVIDKPAGMVVHPAPGNPDHTLVNALLAHCAESLSGIGGVRRPGIVHRLDKDTSGLMVVAKTDQAHRALSAQFADRTLHRVYRALVWGVPAPASGEIEGPIGRHPTQRTRMAVVPEARGGKPALTRYRTLRAWMPDLALIECRLATGRTHQIRVHMAHKGHPLVGDATYGPRGGARRLAVLPPDVASALVGFPRQALHAIELGFRHPVSGDPIHIESRIPNDFRQILDRLES